MPLIWAAISGHGYGHAAQVIPVLNALGRLVPGLTVVLRTTVPEPFFRDRLSMPWTHQPVQQDVGCIQRGPLEIDVPATWIALARFHATWERRIDDETAAMKTAGPRLVLADTPYIASAAGRRAGIPVVALANFTWSEILTPFANPDEPAHHAIMTSIRRSYEQATAALRIAPGLRMDIFQNVRDIGPIAEPATPRRNEFRRHLGIGEAERTVLVGFGGIPMTTLPWHQMEHMTGYRFIFDGAFPRPFTNIHALSALPFTFKELLASVDIVMTKPGYGTTVEAVLLGTPVVYVRRHNFADEPPLTAFLRRYGRCAELSLDDFSAGRWHDALEAAISCARPLTAPPAATGAEDAAAAVAEWF